MSTEFVQLSFQGSEEMDPRTLPSIRLELYKLYRCIYIYICMYEKILLAFLVSLLPASWGPTACVLELYKIMMLFFDTLDAALLQKTSTIQF